MVHRDRWGFVRGIAICTGLILSGAALAQGEPANQNGADSAPNQAAQGAPAAAGQQPQIAGQLQEVVVTATHFATPVDETPLSISAETVGDLLQRGIVNFSDLVGTVPSVQINGQVGTGLANIAIRGILQNGPGAATTGFYLDNVPLQAWNNALTGGVNENGTPLPPIFDLQRVEVLEGPQGTLFGASSEGGTIRYITPAPSLDSWHIYAKLDGSQTDHARGINYAPGLAVGGPIIPGVLGFRGSVYTSHQAGWINMEDPLTYQTIGKGLNSTDVDEYHAAFLWKPTSSFSAQAGLFYSHQSTPYDSDTFNLSEPYPIVFPELGFNGTGRNPLPVCMGTGATATVFQGKSYPGCGGYGGHLTYLRPGYSYGPYDLPRYTIIGETPQLDSPAVTSLTIPSLDLTWTFTDFSAQLFSSYVDEAANQIGVTNSEMTPAGVYGTEGPAVMNEGWGFPANYPEQGFDDFHTASNRRSWAEDLRFSSIDGPTDMAAYHFSWTAGLYYEDDWEHAGFDNLEPAGMLDSEAQALFGESAVQRWGAPAIPFPNSMESYAEFHQELSDTNSAVYAEGNFNITNHLQLTLGVRESIVTFAFTSSHYGPVSGADVPTVANGGLEAGKSKQEPFTPKAELTYRFTRDKLIYFLADEGFRPGGANTPLPAGQCAQGAALYGLTVNDLPDTYNPDTDWNYELGTKLGLANGRVQFNGDIYHILWSNVQSSQAPGGGCGDQFTTNAGHAVSQGIELSGQAIVLAPLTLNAAFGYDHAYYTENAVAVHGAPGFPSLTVAFEGEDFPLAPWTLDLGGRFDIAAAFHLGQVLDPYIRADWHKSAGYGPTSQYPLGSYTPDTIEQPSISELNLRAGVTAGPVDVNVYAINALNFDRGFLAGGRSGCENAACTLYTTYAPFMSATVPFPPLTVGLQFTYTD